MAKLSTTIDKIELSTNRVTGTEPSPDWTDEQYPSAKTLYNTYDKLLNIMHPVGSILTTATNVNPAETLGGTWQLVDKMFKDTYTSINSTHWTKGKAEVSGYSNIFLNDHNLTIRLCLKTTTNITAADVNNASVTLGTLDLKAFGISSLSYAVFNAVAFSDDGQCTVCYRFSSNGQIDLFDVLRDTGAHTLAANSTFYIYLMQPITYNVMPDEYCDKFYWKRTA